MKQLHWSGRKAERVTRRVFGDRFEVFAFFVFEDFAVLFLTFSTTRAWQVDALWHRALSIGVGWELFPIKIMYSFKGILVLYVLDDDE